MFTVVALLFVTTAVAEIASSRRGPSSGKSESSSSERVKNPIEHTADGRPLPFQYYDHTDLSSSTSGTGHLDDSPYYIARLAGIKIHHFVRKNLNMTHALCDRNSQTEAYNRACLAFIFNAFVDVTDGELADHVAIVPGASAAFRSVPSEATRRSVCGPIPVGANRNTFCDAVFWKEAKDDEQFQLFLINTAWTAKKACLHTDHTVDDRCKAKVECLIIETLAVSWPQLFAQKNCDKATLNKISSKSRKNERKQNDD